MNNKKHNKSSMKNLNKLLTNKARYITITLSIIFIVLSKHAISQTIPASDRLEILKNHESAGLSSNTKGHWLINGITTQIAVSELESLAGHPDANG